MPSWCTEIQGRNTVQFHALFKMNIGAVGHLVQQILDFVAAFDATKATQMPGPGAYDTRTKLADK